MFFKAFTKCAFSFTYILFFLLHWIIYVRFVESQDMWCLICLVSPVLVKLYDVFRRLRYGQLRQPCVWSCNGMCRQGGLGVLSLFASFAPTSRSRRFGERRKATTGTSLKIFLERSVNCRMGCFLQSMSRMLGRAGEHKQATNNPLHANATAAVTSNFNQPGHSIANMELRYSPKLQPTLSMSRRKAREAYLIDRGNTKQVFWMYNNF